jgi:hypothetical protein
MDDMAAARMAAMKRPGMMMGSSFRTNAGMM